MMFEFFLQDHPASIHTLKSAQILKNRNYDVAKNFGFL